MHKLLERAYSVSPVPIQNLAVSTFGLFHRSHRLGKGFDVYRNGFLERDTWSIDRMHSYVESELRSVLEHAIITVPYYRQHYAALGLGLEDVRSFGISDLSQLPVTPKDALRSDPQQFLAEDARDQKLSSNPSSGSTGTPIVAVWSSDVRRKCIAAREVRSFGWSGTSMLHSRATIGGRMVVTDVQSRGPFYRYNAVEKQVYLSAYHIKSENAPGYVEGLNKYKPRALTGYAHSYYFLAQHMLTLGLRLTYRPEALILTSEPVSAEMKDVMQAAFGARAFEEYGSVENCFLATECESGSLHVSPDFGIVEILDEAGRPARAGAPGKVVCTGLLNNVQPLIRYEVGDVATWGASSCRCGRDQLPVLDAIEGRLEDVIVGPDGRTMVRFHSLFLNLPSIIEGQVIQEAVDRIRVRVVAHDSFGPAEELAIRARTQQRLGAVQVQVERVQYLPRNKRGKFRAVVSLLTPEQRAQATGIR